MSAPVKIDRQLANAQVKLSFENNQVVAYHFLTNQTVKLQTGESQKQCWLITKIKKMLVNYLPSCFQSYLPSSFTGSARIKVQDKIYFVPRSAIQKAFDYKPNNFCHLKSARGNSISLKCIALKYFQKTPTQSPA